MRELTEKQKRVIGKVAIPLPNFLALKELLIGSLPVSEIEKETRARLIREIEEAEREIPIDEEIDYMDRQAEAESYEKDVIEALSSMFDRPREATCNNPNCPVHGKVGMN